MASSMARGGYYVGEAAEFMWDEAVGKRCTIVIMFLERGMGQGSKLNVMEEWLIDTRDVIKVKIESPLGRSPGGISVFVGNIFHPRISNGVAATLRMNWVVSISRHLLPESGVEPNDLRISTDNEAFWVPEGGGMMIRQR